MSTYDPQLPGAPCWLDIATGDPDATRAFYGAVFGWRAEDPNPQFGGYFNFTKDGVRVAGAMPKQSDETPDGWSIYLTSGDAKHTLDRAVEAGGTAVVDAMDVDTLGTMAIVLDNAGASVGIWRPGDHRGFGLIAEHGAPGWFELHTRDYERAVEFYRTVFDWPIEAITEPPGFRYSLLKRGDEQYAGIMDASDFLPSDQPSVWKVYFAVDDTDASAEQIRSLGGTILMEPVDTPYGRHAEAADPNGATFKLVGPNHAMPTQ